MVDMQLSILPHLIGSSCVWRPIIGEFASVDGETQNSGRSDSPAGQPPRCDSVNPSLLCRLEGPASWTWCLNNFIPIYKFMCDSPERICSE